MGDREEPMDFEEGCTTSLDYPHPRVSMEDAHCDDEDMRSIPDEGLFDATRIQTDKHDDQKKGGRTDAFQRFLDDSIFDLEDVMSPSEYELSIEDLIFTQEREIGRGVSRVGFKRGYFVGYNRDIYKTAAVKRLRKSHEEEVRIIRKLQHPNIISFIAYLEQPHVHFLLITECAEFGSLSGVLKTKRLRSEIPLPEDLFLRWCYDLIRAVEYLHSSKFVWHRDIKSGNCLICSREVLKLCDFGLSREIDDSVSHITTSVGKGTHRWMAPEVIEHRRHSTASDVYSMSMVFLEMCSGTVPFSNIEIAAVVSYKVVTENLRPEIPVECPKYVKSLLPKCWLRDAHNRPKVAEIKQKIVSAMSPEVKDVILSCC